MKKLLFHALLFCTVFACQSQNTFERTYGSPLYEEVWESIITSDSGIVHAGYTGLGGANTYVIKTNRYGDTLWTREIIETGEQFIYSIQETVDKGLIIAGRSGPMGAGGLELYLLKLNRNGIVLWRKVIGGSDNETVNELKQTFDKGFVMVGNTRSFGTANSDFYIVKTDSTGNILWTKTIGGPYNDNAYSVVETVSKNIVVAGLTTEAGNNIDVLVCRLDQNGNILWEKQYGGAGDDRANSIIELPNKDLVVNGLYNAVDALLFKTDSTGTMLWSKRYGTPNGSEWAYSVKKTKTNALIFCGYQNSGVSGADYLVVKTNQNGDTIWAKNFGGNTAQYGTNIEEYFDGTFVMSGYSQISGGDYDYYVVKMDSMGRSSCTNKNSGLAVNVVTLTVQNKTLTVGIGGAVASSTPGMLSHCSMTTMCQNTVTSDGNGCTGAPANNTIIPLNYTVCYGAPANLLLANNYTATGITYQWQSSTVSQAGPYTNISGATSATYATPGLTNTTYYSVVIACASGSSVMPTGAVVVKTCSTVGLQEASAANFRIFPNPVSELFVVENGNGKYCKVIMCNSSGMVVRSFVSAETEISVDCRAVPEGVYFLQLNAGGVCVNKKIVVLR